VELVAVTLGARRRGAKGEDDGGGDWGCSRGPFYRAGDREVGGRGSTAVNGAILSGGGETGSQGDEGGGGDVSLCHERGGGAASERRDSYPKRAARRFQPGRRRLLDVRKRKTVGEQVGIGQKPSGLGALGQKGSWASRE
jgi:hypothetical protein